MDIQAYFRRIGMPEDTVVTHTYEFLKQLQYHHVTHVPYENLDLIDKKLLSLEPEDVYEKMVNQHRGGYCFEVNGLLSVILNQLGFETEDYLARFLRNEKVISFRRHRVVAVKCGDCRYLCDVGIGQSAPRYPLKLEVGLEQEQFGETYKFEKNQYGEWELYDLYKGEWRIFYSFSEEKQYNIDFYPPSYYCETHPKSAFNKTLIISIKTDKGRKTINDREYKEFVGNEPVCIESDLSDDRRSELLLKEFGLDWRAKE